MLKFLQSIFSGDERPGSQYDERLLDAATERLVDATDPRLRAISGYKRKLRPGIECAVDHAVRLGDTVGTPLELTRSAFGNDPRVRALFVSAEHMEEVLNASGTIRQWLSKTPSPPDTLYAFLVVNWQERQAFGMELEGDMVRRDVAQIVLNFSGHRFADIAGSETDLRREVKKRAFDFLVKVALARLAEQRTQRQTLEHERSLLRRKLKELDVAQVGLSLDAAQPAGDNDSVGAETRLAAIEKELAALNADAGTLDDHLATLSATLSAAPEHLQLQPVSFVLDQRNVKCSKPNGQTIHELQYSEARSGARRALAILVQFPRATIHAQADMLAQAERYLR